MRILSRLPAAVFASTVMAACFSAPTTTRFPEPVQTTLAAAHSPAPTPSNTAAHTATTSQTPTLAPPTRRPTATSTPTSGPLTAVPPIPEQGISVTYELERQETIGKYIVRHWIVRGTPEVFIGTAITIVASGQPTTQITQVLLIDELSGRDITGEGDPDLVVVRHTTGVSCCSWVEVYDLGDVVRVVLSSPLSRFSGTFEDLDGNGAFEFITFDDAYNSSCGYPGAVSAKVIFDYNGQEYRPASPKYAQYYQKDIEKHLNWARGAIPTNGDFDGTTKCSVLPLVLDYLYSGQTDKAWEALREYYKYPDIDETVAWLKAKMAKSPYYVPP